MGEGYTIIPVEESYPGDVGVSKGSNLPGV